MSNHQKQNCTFEDPDPTFFNIDMEANSGKNKSSRQISKISFGDVQVAHNFQLDSFGQEIKNIVLESKEEVDDLESGTKKIGSKVREVFVIMELPEIKEHSDEYKTADTSTAAFCHFKNCREIGEEQYKDSRTGMSTWYCKDHYFTIKQEEIALKKQKTEE